MSALRRVLPAAVAFVVGGVVASTENSTVGGRSWPVAGRVAGLGGGLVAWAVVRWWRLRVPTRFVSKYTVRLAHLELGRVSCEHTHAGDLARETEPIVVALRQSDLAAGGLEKAGFANQTGARDVGVGDRHGAVRHKRQFWPNSSAAWNRTRFMFRICPIKHPKAAFHGQAVKCVASRRVSTAQQDVRSQRLAILELGVSKTAIARNTGVSRTTLYSFMSSRGLKPSP